MLLILTCKRSLFQPFRIEPDKSRHADFGDGDSSRDAQSAGTDKVLCLDAMPFSIATVSWGPR